MSHESAAGLASRLAERQDVLGRFLEAEHDALADAAQALARRFALGGTLLIHGDGAAGTDGEQVHDDVVHPPAAHIRALPAIEVGPLAGAASVGLARAGDAVLALSHGDGVGLNGPLAVAGQRGLLRILLTGASPHPALGADHRFVVPSEDAAIVQEVQHTARNLLTEFLQALIARAPPAGAHRDRDGRGPLAGRPAITGHEGALLDPRAVTARAREELGALCAALDLPALTACAGAMRGRLQRGGRLYVLADARSRPTARDVVYDCADLGWSAAALTDDFPAADSGHSAGPGAENALARQVSALVRGTDAVLALSTNGASAVVLEALQESGRRGALTCALIGGDEEPLGAQDWLDHSFVTVTADPLRRREMHGTASHLVLEAIGRREGLTRAWRR